MDYSQQPLNLQELIRRYNEELLSMHSRQQSPAEEPLPDFRRDLAALAAVTPIPTDRSAQEDEDRAPSYVGYLRVYVFSGGGAEPLAGARVAVSRHQEDGDVLFANVVTDADGFTPVITLPTVDPALTMQPGNPQPFVLYDVTVTADGFIPSDYSNIPIYGDTYVTQSAAMVPLIPAGNNTPRSFASGGPTNL